MNSMSRTITPVQMRPVGRDEADWPETWLSAPRQCPVCQAPTLRDPCLNSRAGPGWRCSQDGCRHFWQVRMEPLRRFLAASPPRF